MNSTAVHVLNHMGSMTSKPGSYVATKWRLSDRISTTTGEAPGGSSGV